MAKYDLSQLNMEVNSEALDGCKYVIVVGNDYGLISTIGSAAHTLKQAVKMEASRIKELAAEYGFAALCEYNDRTCEINYVAK